jgi:hypothetical protein
MFSGRSFCSQIGGLLVLCGIFVSVGCSGAQSPDQALNQALSKQGQKKEKVCEFAGKVTIDGQPPQLDKKSKLLVMLYDPSKPDLPIGRRPLETVDSDGSFAFHTYDRADGAPPGKYVVTFAQLKYKKKRGFLGPDQLKNQYNDPDRNAKIPEFNVDVQPPGKKDYEFNLTTPSEATAAGPKALTEIRD